MLTKSCKAPRGGRSAVALAEYMIGYAMCDKGATRAEIREALDGVHVEAESRADLGVNAIWRPSAGQGTRPSSILVRNCSSFSLAAMEMDSDAINTMGIKSSTMHLVTSFQTKEGGKLTDEQIHAMVESHLAKLGLSEHRYMVVIHRDTIVFDRNEDGSYKLDAEGNRIVKDGNIHAHIQVGTCHPVTGLAYDRTQFHRRIAWADREIEVENGIETDRGLAVIQDRGLSTQHIRWATGEELKAWNAERKDERLLRQERRSFEGYRKRDETFARYADATVGYRLRSTINTVQERGRKPTWADIHITAARYGCSIQYDAEKGEVVLRDVGIGSMKYEHRKEIAELRRSLKEQGIEPEEMDRLLTERKSEQAKVEAEERVRKEREGETVLLSDVLELPGHLSDVRSVEASETEIIEMVEAQPRIVLDDVTAQSSTFSRQDVDAWLFARISDPQEIERLGDLVTNHESVRVLAIDSMHPVMTTTDVLAIEDKLAEDARSLANASSAITLDQVRKAIATYEAEQTEKLGTTFRLSDEQRAAVEGITKGSLLSISGLPGVGKTVAMGCVRVLGEQTDRDVVGITLSQAAAERLEVEAGFKCVNSAKAALLEENEPGSVLRANSIIVVDEAAMMDSRSNGRILAAARERGCVAMEVYDLRQLQPIDFGASARIIRDEAKNAGTHFELRDIKRQRNAWHREAVVLMADAITEKDEAKRLGLVTRSLEILEANGAITFVASRDEAIDEAVKRHRINRHLGFNDALLIAADKDTTRHLNEEDRRRSGREGQGLTYLTEGGYRQLSVGDEFVFLENSQGKRGIGILNGDRGIVKAVERDRISVDLHDGRTVSFSPRGYKAWDHSSALSVHKSQGASVSAGTSIIDPSASAELVFVAMSRSKVKLDVIIAESNFRNVAELAEHVAGRISLKTTSCNFEEVVERTGGRDTVRVIHMEREEAARNSRLRRRWEAECKEPALAVRAKRVRELRETYSQKKAEISKDRMLSLSDRISREVVALKQFREAVAVVHKETQPLRYGDWKKELDRAHVLARDLERMIAQRREQDREDEHKRSLHPSHDRADDRDRRCDYEMER